jgi:hypothetical protein
MQELKTETIGFVGSSKLDRILAGAAAGAMISGAAVVAYFDPARAALFPACPLYSLTGFACPGCGLTRGFHALFHGDILTALDFNAMLPLFALLIGFGVLSLVYFAARGRRLPINLLHPAVLYVFLVLLLVFGVTRNLPWYPFTILFP